MRVPTLMWSPGRIPAGKVCGQIASTIDMLPTIAALTGAELPAAKIDGVSILPLLKGAEGARPREVFFYGRDGVRSGNWKLIKPKKAKEFELYDLSTDIAESHDLAREHPDIVDRLQELLTQHQR